MLPREPLIDFDSVKEVIKDENCQTRGFREAIVIQHGNNAINRNELARQNIGTKLQSCVSRRREEIKHCHFHSAISIMASL